MLNPLRKVDERIMDDADLAGPLLFILCFGTFLLLVSRCLLCTFLMSLTSVYSPESRNLDISTASAC